MVSIDSRRYLSVRLPSGAQEFAVMALTTNAIKNSKGEQRATTVFNDSGGSYLEIAPSGALVDELLDATHGERLDARAAGKSTGTIAKWRPWERSTGPKTAEGEASAWRNAYKGGKRALLVELARLIRTTLTLGCYDLPRKPHPNRARHFQRDSRRATKRICSRVCQARGAP